MSSQATVRYGATTEISLKDPIASLKPKAQTEEYNNYLIIGGMPECVASWIKYKDPAKIYQIQRELIEVYENDFSKHNGRVNSGRILLVFRSIVSQLAKPNEKFMYGAVREGGRARDFEEAIEWLVSAGMLNRIYNVSKMEHPLSAFDKLEQFKLFVFDTGLLKHMAGIDNSAISLFRAEWKSYLLKQKEAKTNPLRLLKNISLSTNRNMHCVFQSADIGKTDISQISHYILQERQKTCYKIYLYPSAKISFISLHCIPWSGNYAPCDFHHRLTTGPSYYKMTPIQWCQAAKGTFKNLSKGAM